MSRRSSRRSSQSAIWRADRADQTGELIGRPGLANPPGPPGRCSDIARGRPARTRIGVDCQISRSPPTPGSRAGLSGPGCFGCLGCLGSACWISSRRSSIFGVAGVLPGEPVHLTQPVPGAVRGVLPHRHQRQPGVAVGLFGVVGDEARRGQGDAVEDLGALPLLVAQLAGRVWRGAARRPGR